MIRTEGVAHIEDCLTYCLGFLPSFDTCIYLGIKVHTGQKAGSRAFVGTWVGISRLGHIALVRNEPCQFAYAKIIYIRTGSLIREICTSEGRFLGGERNTSETVQSHPVQVSPDEAGLVPEAVDLCCQFWLHTSGSKFVRRCLAEIFVHEGNALKSTDIDGIDGVILDFRPGIGVQGSYPGIVFPGAFCSICRRLLD